jgi:hypothetical protein
MGLFHEIVLKRRAQEAVKQFRHDNLAHDTSTSVDDSRHPGQSGWGAQGNQTHAWQALRRPNYWTSCGRA